MLFREAAIYNESRGFNGLGYMYMNGLYVEKNVEKAVYYFKSIFLKIITFIEAADYNNSDGHFNYGSVFMMPSTKEIERNKRIVSINHKVKLGIPSFKPGCECGSRFRII